MAGLFENYSSSSSDGDEKDDKDQNKFELDFIPKSMPHNLA